MLRIDLKMPGNGLQIKGSEEHMEIGAFYTSHWQRALSPGFLAQHSRLGVKSPERHMASFKNLMKSLEGGKFFPMSPACSELSLHVPGTHGG